MTSETSNDRKYHSYAYNNKKANYFTHSSTHYNRFSCRSCGAKLIVIKKCIVCNEPILWHCENCDITYDRLHHKHSYFEPYSIATDSKNTHTY